MATFAKWVGYIVIGGVVLLVLLVIVARDDAQSRPNCQVTAVSHTPETFFVNGQPDFGYTVQATVQNNGATGDVTINASLSTSEGNYQRSQTMNLDAGKAQTVQYQFAEPTINASNVQSRVGCSP